MKKLSFVFVAAVSVAAFGCKKKQAQTEGGDCAKAIQHSMDLSKAEMEKMPGMDAKTLQKMVDIGVQRCKDDKWPGDAVKCMVDAKTMADAQGCYGKLTTDQQAKMQKAVTEGTAGDAGSAAGAGSAGSGSDGAGSAMGSDTGSAGAGSAAAGSGDTGSGSAGSAAAPK